MRAASHALLHVPSLQWLNFWNDAGISTVWPVCLGKQWPAFCSCVTSRFTYWLTRWNPCHISSVSLIRDITLGTVCRRVWPRVCRRNYLTVVWCAYITANTFLKSLYICIFCACALRCPGLIGDSICMGTHWCDAVFQSDTLVEKFKKKKNSSEVLVIRCLRVL